MPKNFERKSGNSDESRLAGLLDLSQGRKSFINDLIQIAKLDVVGVEDVYVVYAYTLQAFIHAGGDAFGGEIEIFLYLAIPSHFGSQDKFIARDRFEGFSQNGF